MIIYPAIDILGGKCVRLAKGDYSKVTVYSDNPADFAKEWVKTGASYIHVVDLDGARSGNPVNDEIIRQIVKKSGVPVQTGGGIRSIERIEQLIDAGVSRIILGTAAVRNPDMLDEAIACFKDAIAVGIDARNGFVTTDGWESSSRRRAVEFARDMESRGVRTIIYTDIDNDGMLMGPNLKAMEEMSKSVSCDVIASGGISCLEDIISIRETRAAGVIVGKALYENKLDLSEAILAAGEE